MIARGFIKQEYFEMDVNEVNETDRERIRQIKKALSYSQMHRPDAHELKQRGIMHHRLQSITDELNEFFPNRKSKQQLLDLGVFSAPVNNDTVFDDDDDEPLTDIDDSVDHVPIMCERFTIKGPSNDNYYRIKKRPSIEIQSYVYFICV